jgi:hypothetical protein
MPIDPKDDAHIPDATVYYRHGKTKRKIELFDPIVNIGHFI